MALTPTQEAQVIQLTNQQAALLSLAGNEATITSKLGATKVNLSQLPSASTLGDSDILLVRQGTADKSIAASLVKAASAVPDATDTVKGKVSLAVAANYPSSSDAEAATPAYINSIPKYFEIKPINVAVAANAATLTLNPTTLDFRSATLGSGTVNTRTVSSAISTVISSGSTGGTVNAAASRIILLAIDNAGAVELAWVNQACGINLDENTLISTTAEGGAGAADSATTIYSTTARTSVPFRIVGYFDSTQATAGTWVTAPSLIQGAGGQALSGVSTQTWQNVLASRALGTTYTNSTGKTIYASIACSSTGGISSFGITGNVSGLTFGQNVVYANSNGYQTEMSLVIPAGATYSATTTSANLLRWNELRT